MLSPPHQSLHSTRPVMNIMLHYSVPGHLGLLDSVLPRIRVFSTSGQLQAGRLGISTAFPEGREILVFLESDPGKSRASRKCTGEAPNDPSNQILCGGDLSSRPELWECCVHVAMIDSIEDSLPYHLIELSQIDEKTG